MSFTRQSVNIASIGLRLYLDQTKDSHNGNGYNEFLEIRKEEFTRTKIAKRMNVSRMTINKWLRIAKKE